MLQDGDNPVEGLAIGAVLLVIVALYVRWKWQPGRRWNRRRTEARAVTDTVRLAVTDSS
jgi:hypothetical protein